jgi:HlyD family secretion protein
MTSRAPEGGRAGHCDVDSAIDASVGAQEAALVCELRRLQRFLDQVEERELFSRAVDLQSENDLPGHLRGGAASRKVERPLDRLLDKLGFGRRSPASRQRPRGGPLASVRQSVRQDAKVLFHSWPERAYRVGIAPAAEGGRNRLRSAFEAGRALPRTRRAFEGLRSACSFLATPAYPAGLEGSETSLATKLTRAFEGDLKTGLRMLIAGVGVVGGWACLVPLSGAVIVPGTLVVESDVKKIQHPGGGVVASIPVRDGMQVVAGDLLLHLDETQPRTNAQVLTLQLNQVRARLARLIAERDGLEQPQMPPEMLSRPQDDDLRSLWAAETSLFSSRAAARRTAKELLHSHVGQLGEQIAGLEAQVRSKGAQHELISSELEGVEGLFQKGLVPLARKTSLQREAARLDGERGQVSAAIAEAKSKISEAELQIVRIDHDFRTEVMKDLREAQDKEAELVEKAIAAQDLLKRVDLRAPTNGVVHQLSVHTIGGVIAAGEVVMEIVPQSDELQIEARLPPQDVDHVHREQRASIRFSAFNQRTTPQLEGIVSYVSADLSHDRRGTSNTAWYTVRVTLPPPERRRLNDLQLVSGMPVEVFLQTGSRTMMSYLIKPITDQFLRSFN